MNNFDESKHPRDDEGKFTFKGGGRESTRNYESNEALKGRISKTEAIETPAKILYGSSITKEKLKQAESIYKDVLIDTLGSFATPAMIFYSTPKKLEGIIKVYGLQNKLKDKISQLDTKRKEAINWIVSKGRGIVINKISKQFSHYGTNIDDVIDFGFDSEGNLEIIIADTNDYNEGDPFKLVQAGDIAMKNGKLKPRFTLKHVIIPKDILEKLWGKDYN